MNLSKENALLHYTWGEHCEAWEFVESPSLSIKQERMPAGTAEALHYHEKSQQFFYILSGTATFEIDGKSFTLKEKEGRHIDPMTKHRIRNNSFADLEFILVSEPSAKGDRIDVSV